jgi:hypothetical protein
MQRHRSTATAPVLHVRFSLCGLNSRPLPHFRAQNRPKNSHWFKIKNPDAFAVQREAEEKWER